MSLFSTSAALRPSHCLLLRLASGPTLLTGIPHLMSPLRVKADLRGMAAPGAERKLRSDRVCPQADNATSPRGLCFSAVVLCLLVPAFCRHYRSYQPTRIASAIAYLRASRSMSGQDALDFARRWSVERASSRK